MWETKAEIIRKAYLLLIFLILQHILNTEMKHDYFLFQFLYSLHSSSADKIVGFGYIFILNIIK